MNSNDHLVSAAQHGDRDAFESVVRAHQNLVCATTLSITNDLATSEDLAQQTFLTAWMRLSELQDPRRFGGWIRQIAKNLSLTHLRSQARRSHRESMPSPPIPVIGPEDALVRAEDAQRITHALGTLSADAREVLTLTYRDELGSDEVARTLGISRAAVRKRLQRSREALRSAVDAELEHALRRTRPAAAFTAAVMALIVASPAQASPSAPTRPRWGAAFLGGGFMALSALMLGPRCVQDSSDVVAESPPPVIAKSAPKAISPPPYTPPPQALGTLTPYTLRMRMAGIDVIHTTAVNPFQAGPAKWFPGQDEPRLPDLETTAELHRLLRLENKQSAPPPVDALIRIAEEEAVTLETQLDDPWFQLVAFEVERRIVESEANADLDALVEIAEDRIKTVPSAELADLYRMYVVHLQNGERAIEATRALLASEIPEHRAVALDALGRPSTLPHLDETDLELAANAVDDLPERDLRRGYRTLLGLSLMLRDWTGATHFAAKHRERVERQCPTWPLVAGQNTGLCHFWTEDVDRLDGQIAAGLGTRPKEWRQALVAAIWTCHLENPTDGVVHLETQTAEGQWRWDPWPQETEFTRCLDSARPDLPHPPDGQPVHLDLMMRVPPE